MCHLRHRLRFFCLMERLSFILDIKFHSSSFHIFSHPMIYQICDIMMSINTWDKRYFWIYLLNHNSLTHQTWSIDRYKQGQYFFKIFWTIWRTGVKFQALFNLATCSNYSITNYVKFPMIHFFESWMRVN